MKRFDTVVHIAERPSVMTPAAAAAFAELTAERGILFGGDYNPEQWPREVWREDVELMQ